MKKEIIIHSVICESIRVSNNVIRDIMALSSGTMANLTGNRQYAVLDEVQSAWVELEQKHPTHGTWNDSWKKHGYDAMDIGAANYEKKR